MIEVLKQALDALEFHSAGDKIDEQIITSLRQAIAKLESQEPVALPCCGYRDASAVKWNPLNDVVQCHNCGQNYTTSQRTWVGLTDDEIEEGIKQSWVTEQAFQSAAWWAEAKLKEKNT